MQDNFQVRHCKTDNLKGTNSCLFIDNMLRKENILPMWANTVIAVSAGLLFGLITLLVQYVGLFMLGFHGGLLLGLIGLVVADMSRRLIVEHNENSAEGALLGDDYTPLHSPWISVGTLLASGLVMSLCNLYFQVRMTQSKYLCTRKRTQPRKVLI